MAHFESDLASAPNDFHPGKPTSVFLGEAIDVASAARRHWQPSGTGEHARPGLVEAGARLSGSTIDDLVRLVALGQEAHTDYLLTVNPRATKELLAKADSLADDLEASLEFLFDDGVEDEKDLQLTAVKANDSDTIDGRALDLEELVALAEENLPELKKIPAFEGAWIGRAKETSRELRALPPPNTDAPEAKAKLARRNQVFHVLDARVKAVRAAARFIFRRQPEIVREFTSSYERRRRTALRRAKEKAQPAPQPAVA